MVSRTFYGWRMVAACLVVAVFGWSLGLFGASVYLHAVVETRGWSLGLVSSAVTLFYLVSAFSLPLVGAAIARFGPQPVIGFGALAMGLGVMGVGRVVEPWHVHAAFLVMGLGWASLSTTAVATTLAPWFEKHQGRAVSTAMMGASIGGMIGVPALLYGIASVGFETATLLAGLAALAVLLPLAIFVLRRRPQDMGLLPDGELSAAKIAPTAARRWTRREALRTAAFWSVVLAFGLGLLVQIGFLTHHVALLAPALGAVGTGAVVSATAAAGALGRLALAGFADRIDVRLAAAAVLLAGTAAMTAIALFPAPAVLAIASILYGLTLGYVTTLGPIIVRREFGAASFGAIYGVAAMGTGLGSATGPSLFGLLHDAFGGYATPLLIAAALDVLAAVIVVWGGRRPPA